MLVAFLWLGYVPSYLLLTISRGNSAPLVLFGLSVTLLYIGERRRMPWLATILGIVIVFPFLQDKNAYRQVAWHGGDAHFDNVGAAMTSVLTYTQFASDFISNFSAKSLGFALHHVSIRFDLPYIFAHVKFLTPDRIPYLAGESYSDLLWKLVPRLIYPDKPEPMWGQIFGTKYYILNLHDYTTVINFPQMIEMYANFGTPGVLIGMFLLAQVYSFLTYFMNRPGAGDWMTVFAISIFTPLLLIESNLSLIVAGTFYHLVLVYVVGFFIRTHHRRIIR